MGIPTGNTQPCPSCRSRGRDRSGDNLVSYDDGSAHCFACGYDEQPNKKAMVEEYDMIEFEGVARLPIKALDVRGIGVEWARLYGVRAEVSPETGEPVAFYYPLHRDPGMSLVGYQRKAAKAPGERQKGDVSRVGDTKGVLPFGAHVAKRGGSMVIVTEGAEDCLAAAQLLAEKGKRYRVVACLGVDGWKRNLEYYESFSKVAIAFDQDEAGQRAAQEFAEALSSGKAHIMRWKGPEDPNALVDHPNGADLFLDALNQAKPHNSAGIIYGEEVWERMQNFVEPKGVPYPEEWERIRAMVGDIREAEITMFTGGSSVGKCLAPDTPVLLADGTVVAVSQVKVGDFLLGPDGKGRRVTFRHDGVDDMYRVRQQCGMDYVVNSQHILSTIAGSGSRRYSKGQRVDIGLQEYLELPARERKALRGWVPGPVEWDRDVAEVEHPYTLGLWLAEGRSRGCGTSMTLNLTDYEAIKHRLPEHTTFQEKGHCIGVRIVQGKGSGPSLASRAGILQHKHVPESIRWGSIEVRRQFLAGYLDGDGYRASGGIEYLSESRDVAEGIAWVARSLGFRVTLTQTFKRCQNFAGAWYWRGLIKGPVWTLPMAVVRKQVQKRATDHQLTGLTIEPVGRGPYVGIEVDGDSLYLLADWTVVHNTAYTRTIKAHLLLNTDARIGEVELEERGEKTWRGVMEVALGKPWATATKEERREAWEMTYGTNRIFTLDHRSQYGRGQSLIGKFKHLHYNMGCNILFLDHITLAVHEFGDGSGGNQAQDQMMNEFLEFVETTGCHLFLVSHLRKSAGGGQSFEEGAVPSMDDLKGCTDADTEYLSPSGWRRIADYDGGLVAQWENGALSYVTPEYIKLPSTEPFYHFRNANNLDMMLSGEHRMLLGGSVRTAKDVAHKPGRAVVPTTWHVGGEGIGLGVWDIRLRVMTAADGCYDGTRVKLELRKERKIRRAEEILMATGLPYRKRLTERGTTVFTYPRPAWEKALHLSANWYSANTEELSILLDEVLRWDGCKHSRSGDYFATDKEGEADVVQWAAHACGRVARKRAYGKHYQVSVARPGSAKNQVVLRGDNLYIDRVVSSDGWKYCFTVPSSFFIARRNGRIFVTGNSGSLKQISFNIIGASRNLQHADEYQRNVSQLHVLKVRETGRTGPADRLYYDATARRLVPAMDEQEENEDDLDF